MANLKEQVIPTTIAFGKAFANAASRIADFSLELSKQDSAIRAAFDGIAKGADIVREAFLKLGRLFLDLPEDVQKFVVAGLAASAVLAPLATLVTGFTAGLAGLAAVFGSVLGPVTKVAGALLGFTTPIGLVTSAVTALGIAFALNFGDIRERVNSSIGDVVDKVDMLIAKFQTALGPNLENITVRAINLFDAMVNLGLGISNLTIGSAIQLTEALGHLLAAFDDLLELDFPSFSLNVTKAFAGIGSAAVRAFSAILEGFNVALANLFEFVGLKGVAENFREIAAEGKAALGSFANISDEFHNINQSAEGTVESLRKQRREVRELEREQTKLSNGLENLEAAGLKGSVAYNTLSGRLQQVSDTLGIIGRLQDDNAQGTDGWNAAVARGSTLLEDSADSAKILNDSLKPVVKTTEELELQTSDTASLIRAENEKTAKSFQTVVEAIDEGTEAVKRFEEIGDSLATQKADFQLGIIGSDEFLEILISTRDRLKEQATTLKELGEIEAYQKLASEVDNLNGQIASLEKVSIDAQKEIEKAAEDAQKEAEKAAKAVQDQIEEEKKAVAEKLKLRREELDLQDANIRLIKARGATSEEVLELEMKLLRDRIELEEEGTTQRINAEIALLNKQAEIAEERKRLDEEAAKESEKLAKEAADKKELH